MREIRVRIVALVIMLAVFGGVAGYAASAQEATPAATPATGGASAVREVIGGGTPVDAPENVLNLVRYVIEPGAKLPPHTHPGMQVNVVESGTLHYVVVEGSITYLRAADAGNPGATQTLSGGQEIDFYPGDTFTEPEGMVHYGENRTARSVILYTASLFEADQPPSTIVEATPAS
jgi:mannose-6-phosphate isomerase-like protein (cupin superfamily)